MALFSTKIEIKTRNILVSFVKKQILSIYLDLNIELNLP